jgi:hypothetical protein
MHKVWEDDMYSTRTLQMDSEKKSDGIHKFMKVLTFRPSITL